MLEDEQSRVRVDPKHAAALIISPEISMTSIIIII